MASAEGVSPEVLYAPRTSPVNSTFAPSDEKKSTWDNESSTNESSITNKGAAVTKFADGVDVSVNLVAGHAGDITLDPEEARRIRRKLDWNLLPLLFLLYTGECIGCPD